MLSKSFFQPANMSRSDTLDAWMSMSSLVSSIMFVRATPLIFPLRISVTTLLVVNAPPVPSTFNTLNTAPKAASITSTTMMVPAVTSTSLTATTVSWTTASPLQISPKLQRKLIALNPSLKVRLLWVQHDDGASQSVTPTADNYLEVSRVNGSFLSALRIRTTGPGPTNSAS